MRKRKTSPGYEQAATYVTPAVRERIVAAADEQGQAMSTYIRGAILDRLKRDETPPRQRAGA